MFLLQLLLFYLCGVRAFYRCQLTSVTHCRKISLQTLKMAKANKLFRILKPKSLPDSETIASQAASGLQKDSPAILEPSSNISDSSKLIAKRSKITTQVDSEASRKAAKISPISPSNQSALSTDEIELNITAAKEEISLKLGVESALEAPDSLEPDDYVSRLRDTGVVRVNSVIQSDVVNQLVSFIQKELADSIHAVTANEVQPLDRFSNMLSSNNRWDLKLPLDNPIMLNALRKIFSRQASVSKILTSLVTERGELFELAAFCTSSGAARQVVHADTLWSKHPALYTCAIALQDVTEDMGPTLFLPGSHTRAVHRQFDSSKTKNDILTGRCHVLSTLKMGDMSIYDSRVLHCGTANRSDKERILLYATFKNPSGPSDDDDFWNVASIRPEYVGKYCLNDFMDDEVLRLLTTFRFYADDVKYLQSLMPNCESEFFAWLLTLDCSKTKVYSLGEGSICFPRQPLIRIEGPLAIGQLLETTLLNLVNFPSLIATNAARMRLVAGPEKVLLEFGLRRAQGPDGAISASKYAYVGGFDGTSNVLAGKLTGIDVKGTHAHAYIMCYSSLSELHETTIAPSSGEGKPVEFLELVLQKRRLLGYLSTNEGELAAFISYAQAFPRGLLALVDTYDTVQSGVPNFLCVAWALFDLGYRPLGVRLDSGDLAYLSRTAKAMFTDIHEKTGIEGFLSLSIVASNDINENILLALNREGHEITTFGIGTHLVTCQSQPALGCVYKLVEINGQPRIKLSQEVEKLVIPCRKNIYRLVGADGKPLVDIMLMAEESPPIVGERILCRHPFMENKRAYVTPSGVVPLLELVWDGPKGGIQIPIKPLPEAREHCKQQIAAMRSDHTRPVNPTPYKISVSQKLYEFIHQLWMAEAPIADLS